MTVAASVGPAVNNALVVNKNSKISTSKEREEDSAHKELEAHSLQPTNASVVLSVPVWVELPGSLLRAENNGNTTRGAGV
jgi:hypothetical protein